MSSLAVPQLTTSDPYAHDPVLRDSRHRSAQAARELEFFLAWLELENLGSRTIATYEWTLARLLRTFPDKRLDEFTDGDIAFVLRSFPQSGRRTRAAAFRKFFDWAKRTKRIQDNPMELLPRIRRQQAPRIDVFTDAEIAALTKITEPDGTLMLLLLDAGLRKAEARNLRVQDIDLDQRLVIILNGKGRKDRVIPMTDRLVQRLAYMVTVEGLSPRSYIWYSRPGGYHVRRDRPISETAFTLWWRRSLDEAVVRYRKPHTTRHTFATRWIRAGGRLETLSRAMGHDSIRTTADFYAHMDVSDLLADVALTERD